MYDRVVDVPRLVASLRDDSDGHPILRHAARIVMLRYGVRMRSATLLLYRDGSDSVAPHSDRGAAGEPGAMTITLSLGTPRALHMKPKEGGPSQVFRLGWGDLFAMGPTVQQTYVHGVPKVREAAPRMAVVFWTTRVDSRR